MPRITVLPHPECAPSGASIVAAPGTSICDALLENDVDIEHGPKLALTKNIVKEGRCVPISHFPPVNSVP